VSDWSSPAGLAQSIGVPGYSDHAYTHICLTFWTCRNGPLDAALLWQQPSLYFGTQKFGGSDQAIRSTLKALYGQKGVKLMVSAFGATEMPTTEGMQAVACANKLADYVQATQLDGVDIDWEDTAAFQQAHWQGEQWLADLTIQLRARLPWALISHAPQAPYFGGTGLYPGNGYLRVEQQVGHLIQFYNVQFYNQQSTSYGSVQALFNSSGGWAPGTSVNEINSRGVPLEKIVVGKPATPADAYD
jgi:hypothetical protein